MDNTLSQILTYLYATLQENARLEQEVAVLKAQVTPSAQNGASAMPNTVLVER